MSMRNIKRLINIRTVCTKSCVRIRAVRSSAMDSTLLIYQPFPTAFILPTAPRLSYYKSTQETVERNQPAGVVRCSTFLVLASRSFIAFCSFFVSISCCCSFSCWSMINCRCSSNCSVRFLMVSLIVSCWFWIKKLIDVKMLLIPHENITDIIHVPSIHVHVCTIQVSRQLNLQSCTDKFNCRSVVTSRCSALNVCCSVLTACCSALTVGCSALTAVTVCCAAPAVWCSVLTACYSALIVCCSALNVCYAALMFCVKCLRFCVNCLLFCVVCCFALTVYCSARCDWNHWRLHASKVTSSNNILLKTWQSRNGLNVWTVFAVLLVADRANDVIYIGVNEGGALASLEIINNIICFLPPAQRSDSTQSSRSAEAAVKTFLGLWYVSGWCELLSICSTIAGL